MNKAFLAAVELGNLMHETQSKTIALLTEPHIYKNSLISLPPGTRKFQKHNVNARAAIVCSPDTQLIFLDNISSRDACAVILNTNEGNIMLASIYCDINNDIEQPLRFITEYAKTRKLPLVMGLIRTRGVRI